MIIPTEEQIIDRWDTLPMSLKEALTSDVNSDFVWKIAAAEHVPDEKIYDIGRAVSHVLYGFISPEELVAELKDGSQINVQSVTSIANQLNQKIFAPLKQDISRIYQPLSKVTGGPKILEEVKRPEPIPTPVPPAPKPLGQVTSQTATGFNVKAAPMANNKNVAAPAPAPVASQVSTDKGWAKGMAQNPVVRLGVISPGTPSPTPPPVANAGAPTTTSPKPTAPQQTGGGPQPASKGMSEFERLDMLKKASAPGQLVTQSQVKPPQPAPVMLHEVSKSAEQSSPNFRFNQTAQNQINTAAPQKAAPPKPAVIEFANSQTSPASPPVHYSEYKPPASSMPPISANNTPRQVTEILPPKQQVTAPPPPPPPTNPANKDKVIVQNFL